MKQFVFGLTVGLGLATIGAQAGSLYDSKGNVQAPAGSPQQFDYFRQRQQQLDVGAMRRQLEQQKLQNLGRPPCP